MISQAHGNGSRGGAARIAAVAVLALALLALLSANALAQDCGRVHVAHLGPAKVRVVRGRASCRGARRLIAAAFHPERTRPPDSYASPAGDEWEVLGWWCLTGLADTQTYCTRGSREIHGSLRQDDGWRF
jgi:hypothetical protein